MARVTGTQYVFQAIGALIGLGYGTYLLGSEVDFSDPTNRVATIRYCVVPVVIAAAFVVFMKFFLSAARLNATFSKNMTGVFEMFVSGLEFTYFLFAWSILQSWLRKSGDDYYEPLFVAIGVAIAVLDFLRRLIRNFDSLDDDEATIDG